LSIVDLAQTYRQPLSVDAAISALGGGAVALAGGTWIMRAPLRDEDIDRIFVSLAKIPALHLISVDAGRLKLGALVTHHALAAAVVSLPEMAALAQAAGHSANPAIRRTATIGGNICTQGFAAADLVPACVALGASVAVQSAAGASTLPIEDYMRTRASRPEDEILCTISVPRRPGRSAHARGLLRQAGEYPVANVSVYLELDKHGMIATLRIAVGAVEALPKRWRSLEQALTGQPLKTPLVADLVQSLTDEFTPRDGIDAPGWYRLRILPRLVEQAFGDVAAQMEGAG